MKKIINIPLLLASFIVTFLLIPVSFLPEPIINISKGAETSLIDIPVTVDSAESELTSRYLSGNAIDGNENTLWCTQHGPYPHSIVLDAGKNYQIKGFQYLPRQDGYVEGNVSKYEIYVSTDDTNWGSAVASGTWEKNSTEKEVLFSGKIGRYVKFVSLEGTLGDADCSAELKVLGLNEDGSAIETPVTEINEITNTPTAIQGVSVDSAESELTSRYLSGNAIDGNENTLWCTQHGPYPHSIVLDAGKNYQIKGFQYLPRQDGYVEGNVSKYEIYVSTDDTNWGSAVASGTWEKNSTEKEVLFSGKIGRYVKFVSLEGTLGDADCSAELKVLGLNEDGSAIEEMSAPEPTPIPTVQGNPKSIPGIAVNSCSSELNNNYLSINSIDRNRTTLWCTQHLDFPHNIVLDTAKSHLITGLRYLPRQDGYTETNITKYEIYVSVDNANWGTALASGTWDKVSAEKEVTFSGKIGRYVKFVILAGTDVKAVCTSELKVLGFNEDGSEIWGAEEEENTWGPNISVGLWSYTKDGIKETPFKIEANKNYNIKNSSGVLIASVRGDTITRVSYDSDKNFLVYKSIPEKLVNREVIFEAADGDNSNIIFDIYRPSSSYDRYRGKIKIRYTDSNNIWVINTLPMEQYVWGMGETTGTGPFEHTKVMTMIFRTYGFQYITWSSTKWVPYGFRIRSDSGSQIYRGYDWEITYPNIKKAAEETRGKIVTYNDEVALTPYSSWSDGRTRSFEERWGSDDYPWCQSVKDPYGKHPSLSTTELENYGNHMVGLIGNGSVKLAGDSYKKKYDWILKYYYTGISIKEKY